METKTSASVPPESFTIESVAESIPSVFFILIKVEKRVPLFASKTTASGPFPDNLVQHVLGHIHLHSAHCR